MELEAGDGKSSIGGRRGVRRPGMRGNQCIPRLGRGGPRLVASPVLSMLERFQEAVLRLIMLSAISKSNGRGGGGGGGGGGKDGSICGCPATNRAYYSQESHYTEDVADCIDFIKRSSASSSAVVLAGGEPVGSDVAEVEGATVPAVA